MIFQLFLNAQASAWICFITYTKPLIFGFCALKLALNFELKASQALVDRSLSILSETQIKGGNLASSVTYVSVKFRHIFVPFHLLRYLP